LGSTAKPANSKSVCANADRASTSWNGPRARARADHDPVMPSSLRPLPAAHAAVVVGVPGAHARPRGHDLLGEAVAHAREQALAPSSLDGHQLISTCSGSSGSQSSTAPAARD
jgi:hypothetical protein